MNSTSHTERRSSNNAEIHGCTCDSCRDVSKSKSKKRYSPEELTLVNWCSDARGHHLLGLWLILVYFLRFSGNQHAGKQQYHDAMEQHPDGSQCPRNGWCSIASSRRRRSSCRQSRHSPTEQATSTR